MEHLLAVLGLAAGCVLYGLLMIRRARDKAALGVDGEGGCGGCASRDRCGK